MSPATMKLLGVGGGVGLLVWLFLRKGKGSLLSAEATTTYFADPANCRCMRKRPIKNADGKVTYAVEVEPDYTLCVEAFSNAEWRRCFEAHGGAPANELNPLAYEPFSHDNPKTSDIDTWAPAPSVVGAQLSAAVGALFAAARSA